MIAAVTVSVGRRPTHGWGERPARPRIPVPASGILPLLAASQLKDVSLKPDVLVRPTIAGIRAGRDEVLERAVAWVRTHVARAGRTPPSPDHGPLR